MKWLTGLAPRWRVALLGLFAAIAGLLLAGLALLFYDTQSYREQKTSEVTVQAQILAASVTAALVFDDADAIQEYLNALRANPDLDAAAVYDSTGRRVAQTARGRTEPLPATHTGGVRAFSSDFVVVADPVLQGRDHVGWVYLRVVAEPLIRRVSRYGALILLLSMASLVVAVLVATQAALRRTNAELVDTNRELRVQITERERAEEALRQAQKMEAVGQLTGGIAHDFNNMLAIIIGSLTLLKRRAARGERDLEKYAEGALEGAQRAATLTQRLLAFSRRQALNPQPVDPNKLIAGMSELLRRTLGETIQVETVLAGGAWMTRVDPHQLESAILNLALNSRDAMAQGGRLTIETGNAHLDDRYAQQDGVPAGQYAMIAVSDTGGGMAPEILERAFEPFFTTKAVGKGTGLGLSQVYGFVRQSGGHVKIYSEVGQGTTVKIYLPRLYDAQAEDDAPTPTEVKRSDGVTVLVVEDEPGVRRMAVEAFAELGYQPLEADGAATALRLLDQHPDVKLLFTDIVMPETNGRKLADEAVRRRPDLKVLFTTGYTRNAVVHNGIVDPGVHLLGKPFTLEQLGAKVREVLEA